MDLGSEIRDPEKTYSGSGIGKKPIRDPVKPIPDPGSRGRKDTGSASATLHFS